jgi:rod shape determining protein RodA
MRGRILKNIEWGILICCIALFVIGCIALYSATQETEFSELKRQIIWFAVSIPIMIVVICIDYNTITKVSPIFYGIFIILLIAVLFTDSINGASSWFTITDRNTVSTK